MCACTLWRISAISRCASFDSSCVSANDVAPCTSVAATTMPTSGKSFSTSRLPMTSSISHLVDAGSTSPVTRLTAMSTKPSASMARRGSMSLRIMGHTARNDGAGLGLAAAADVGGAAAAGAAAEGAADDMRILQG